MNTEFRIVFVDRTNDVVSEIAVAVPGHWEACNEGLHMLPSITRATDFQVHEAGEV